MQKGVKMYARTKARKANFPPRNAKKLQLSLQPYPGESGIDKIDSFLFDSRRWTRITWFDVGCIRVVSASRREYSCRRIETTVPTVYVGSSYGVNMNIRAHQ
jgi:hypothetical protein